MFDIIGICLGNTLWFAGLICILIGVWGVKVEPESIRKIVNMLKMTTGGTPKGFALKLNGLIEPVVRTKVFGRNMLIGGAVIMIIGATMLKA